MKRHLSVHHLLLEAMRRNIVLHRHAHAWQHLLSRLHLMDMKRRVLPRERELQKEEFERYK
jgi:hypothetical protein